MSIAEMIAGLPGETRVALAGRVLRQPRMSLAATALVDRHA
jgi:hypothetical protein